MPDLYRNFKYLWRAEFDNGHIIKQDPDDLYSKHDPKAEHNPSSFKDFLDYQEQNPDVKLVKFCLFNDTSCYTVSFVNQKRPVIYYDETNRYGYPVKHHEWFKSKRDLENVRVIYYRRWALDMLRQTRELCFFAVGFQGNEENGRNFKKEVRVV